MSAAQHSAVQAAAKLPGEIAESISGTDKQVPTEVNGIQSHLVGSSANIRPQISTMNGLMGLSPDAVLTSMQ